jgi:GNAT superfamily N-acetyltransferase
VAQWKPGAATLSEAVSELPLDFLEAPPETGLAASLELFHEAMTAVPEEFRPDPDEDGLAEAYASWVRAEWPGFRAPVNRYIAAKAFASWTAYQGRGVATIVRGIEAAVALVRVEAARRCRDAGKQLDADLLLEAFRSADFTLNHLAVGEDLAENWSRIEHSYRPNTAITGP